MTGLRLGYVATKDEALRDRMKRCCYGDNVVGRSSGGVALEGSGMRRRLLPGAQARRDLFYAESPEHAAGIFTGVPRACRYRIPSHQSVVATFSSGPGESQSWSMAQS